MKYVVFDIDGVLARPNPERMALIGALPGGGTDWEAFYATDFSKDVAIEAGNELLEAIWMSVNGPLEVCFLTSRRICVQKQTADLLFRIGEWGCAGRLLMREDGDDRPADVVKLDLLRAAGLSPANVFCVVDDELENANAFAAAGYTSLLFKEGVK